MGIRERVEGRECGRSCEIGKACLKENLPRRLTLSPPVSTIGVGDTIRIDSNIQHNNTPKEIEVGLDLGEKLEQAHLRVFVHCPCYHPACKRTCSYGSIYKADLDLRTDDDDDKYDDDTNVDNDDDAEDDNDDNDDDGDDDEEDDYNDNSDDDYDNDDLVGGRHTGRTRVAR